MFPRTPTLQVGGVESAHCGWLEDRKGQWRTTAAMYMYVIASYGVSGAHGAKKPGWRCRFDRPRLSWFGHQRLLGRRDELDGKAYYVCIARWGIWHGKAEKRAKVSRRRLGSMRAVVKRRDELGYWGYSYRYRLDP